jgi:hypothetical protein
MGFTILGTRTYNLQQTLEGGNDPVYGPWCSYGGSWSLDGTVTGFVAGPTGPLTFAGTFVNGSSGTSSFLGFDEELFSYDISVPFRGSWSNGWYSTGTVEVSYDLTTYPQPFAGLVITTITPEPATLVLLATGILPIIGGFRRKYRK